MQCVEKTPFCRVPCLFRVLNLLARAGNRSGANGATVSRANDARAVCYRSGNLSRRVIYNGSFAASAKSWNGTKRSLAGNPGKTPAPDNRRIPPFDDKFRLSRTVTPNVYRVYAINGVVGGEGVVRRISTTPVRLPTSRKSLCRVDRQTNRLRLTKKRFRADNKIDGIVAGKIIHRRPKSIVCSTKITRKRITVCTGGEGVRDNSCKTIIVYMGNLREKIFCIKFDAVLHSQNISIIR